MDLATGTCRVCLRTSEGTPTARPGVLWAALREMSDLDLPRPRSTRLAQGTLGEDGTIVDALG